VAIILNIVFLVFFINLVIVLKNVLIVLSSGD